jgi:hypothetical protein
MSVTWPITPNGELDPATRPIPFVTERDVTAVSVSFGSGRVEERAYRDGAFLWPYLRSTREGNTFTLVRDDGEAGWPANPKPFVDEEPAPPVLPEPPAGGQPWGAIYDLDFTALTTGTISLAATGPHVIDGLTWRADGAISAGSIAITSTGLNWSSGGSDVTRTLSIALTSIPGFNAMSPYQVWFQHSGTGGNDGVLTGICDTTVAGVPIVANYSDGMVLACPMRGANGDYFIHRVGGNTGFVGLTHNATWTNIAHGILAATNKLDLVVMSPWASGPLPPGDPFDVNSYYTTGHSVRAYPTIVIKSEYLRTSTFTRMTVVQPKVAP